MEIWLTVFLVLIILSVAAYFVFSKKRSYVYAALGVVWSIFAGFFTMGLAKELKRKNELEEIEDEFMEEEPADPSVVSDRANKLIDRLRAKRDSSK